MPRPVALPLRSPLGLARLGAALATVAVVFAVATPGEGGVAAAAATTPTPSVGIPAYFYPAGTGLTYWDQLRAGAPTVSTVIATGLRLETTAADSNYQAQIAKTRAAGIKVLAYVTTSGGDTPVATAKAEMDHAFSWYGVDGIFFDESVRYPVTCGQTDYYRSLSQYAKAVKAGALTVLNHGQILPECYADTADVLMTAETSASDYRSAWKPWGWEQNYPATKFWHLVHSTSSVTELQEMLSLARSRNAGRIFVTSATMSSPGGPYGSLPTGDFWSSELSAVSAAGRGFTTTVAPTTTTTRPPATSTTVAPTTTTTTKPPATSTTVAPTTTGPSITSFSPTSGPPGATVVISGRGLANVVTVTLAGAPVQVLAKSDTSVTVKLNTWNNTGTFWLYVVGGAATTSTGTFTVVR